MSAAPEPKLTAAEYLVGERAAQVRHEFVNGEVCAMSGASGVHNQIALSVASHLNTTFSSTKCQAFISDMRVGINSANSYFYPDVVATCESATFADDVCDTLMNPLVVIEVLSPSTEKFDRVRKFKAYQQIASLKHYVLITQDFPQVERFSRVENGNWEFWAGVELEDVLELAAIDCSIPFETIYAKLDFPRDADGQLTIVREMLEQYHTNR